MGIKIHWVRTEDALPPGASALKSEVQQLLSSALSKSQKLIRALDEASNKSAAADCADVIDKAISNLWGVK